MLLHDWTNLQDHSHCCLLHSLPHHVKQIIPQHLLAWQPSPILAHWYWSSHDHRYSRCYLCWCEHCAIPLLWSLTAIYEASVFADMVEVMRYLISYSAWKAFCQRSRALPHLLSYSLHHTNMKTYSSSSSVNFVEGTSEAPRLQKVSTYFGFDSSTFQHTCLPFRKKDEL